MAKKKIIERWMQAARTASVFALLCIIAYLSSGYGFQMASNQNKAYIQQAYAAGQKDGQLTCRRTSGEDDWLRIAESSLSATLIVPTSTQMRSDF